MKKLLPSTLAATLAIVGMLPAFADSVTTTTTVAPSTAPAQVIDSYMKPVVTQTKSVTASDGSTQTSSAPLIMERHETVAVPTSEVTTTTTATSPQVVEEVTTKKAEVKSTATVRKVAHKPRRVAKKRTHVTVAHKVSAPKVVAETHVRKVIEPAVIEQTQTVEQKGVIIDRKDPALEP